MRYKPNIIVVSTFLNGVSAEFPTLSNTIKIYGTYLQLKSTKPIYLYRKSYEPARAFRDLWARVMFLKFSKSSHVGEVFPGEVFFR